MTTRSTLRVYGGLVVLLSAACSGEPSNQGPVVTDAGDAGIAALPLLPLECDKAPTATSTGAGSLVDLAHAENRIRVSGSTIYYHRSGGIHAIQVPGGTGSLLVPYPPKAGSGDPTTPSPFDDFWADDKSIMGAVGGALYTAPLSGGAPELLPGYEAGPPSPWEYGETSYYARSAQSVYRSTRVGESTAAIERLALAGGPRSTFVPLRAPEHGPIVVGGQSLYFVDREEGDDDKTASIFATPLDASAPVPVARHLRDPRILGFVDGRLYFDDASRAEGQLWRMRDSTIEKVTTPGNVAFSVVVDETRFAAVGGVGYVTARALYRLPNGAGTTLRDVVLRTRSDDTTAEIAHCFPDWTADAAGADRFMFFIDLAANESRLYFALSLVDRTSGTWEDEIVELAP
jgi:hypothetical protein